MARGFGLQVRQRGHVPLTIDEPLHKRPRFAEALDDNLKEGDVRTMMNKKKDAQTFPVMDGALPAPREDQIAGIVQRVWADSQLYHSDVEPLLREWLNTVGCTVAEHEFQILLNKAKGEFARVASATSTDPAPHCPAGTLVACLYWDVQTLERGGSIRE